MLVLALCLLWPPALLAGPLDAGFSPGAAVSGDPAPLPAPGEGDAVGSALEYVDRDVFIGTFPGSGPSPQPDLAAVAPPEKTPSAWTLLIIGGAMVWLAGVFRYRPRR